MGDSFGSRSTTLRCEKDSSSGARTPTVRALLAVSGHAPSGLWRGSALAAEIEATLQWALHSNLPFALSTDALTFAALALDSPDVTGGLVEAIVEGKIELVGGTYASINGLLAGGEANLRNRCLGASTFMRLACSPAITHWLRHYDVWPQEPQLLRSCGIEGVVLVTGRTRTNSVTPQMDDAVFSWIGADGTKIATVARSKTAGVLPMQVQEALERAVQSADGGTSAIVATWVPTTLDERATGARETIAQAIHDSARAHDLTRDCATLPRTILQLSAKSIEADPSSLPDVELTADSTWHGQLLGINGDRILRACSRLERALLDIEALASLQPFLGKRDDTGSYPHWELGEAWRGLLSAQHQEVREREHNFAGIAIADVTRAQSLVDEVRRRLEAKLTRRVPGDKNGSVVLNSLGWERNVPLDGGRTATVPAMGWLALPNESVDSLVNAQSARLRLAPEDDELVVSAAGLRVKIHRKRGVITQIFSEDFPQGMLAPKQELLAFELRNDDGVERFEDFVEVRSDIYGIKIDRHGKRGKIELRLEIRENPSRIVIHAAARDLPRPGCRPEVDDDYGDTSSGTYTRDAFGMRLVAKLGAAPRRIVDTPYHVDAIDPRKAHTLRYTGTSGKVEEKILAPFTAASFVDLVEPQTGRGLLYMHDGGQGFVAEREGARAILSMWDALGSWIDTFESTFALMPHGPLTNEQRARLASEHRSPLQALRGRHGDGQLPDRFGALKVDGEHALLTALFREDERIAELLTGDTTYRDDDDTDHGGPWVARLVEIDGVRTAVRIAFPCPVDRVTKGSPLGEAQFELERDRSTRNAYLLELGPREIATIRFRYSR